MSSEIESLTDEVTNDYVFWALKTGLWDGRIVPLEEASRFFIETKSRIEALLFSQDPDSFDFKKIAVPLAWIGSQPQERLGLLNEIEELRTLANGAVVLAKSKHEDKQRGRIESPYDLDRFRKSYDQELLETREILIADGLAPVQSEYNDEDRSFWQKHGRQILVAAAIVAIVATVIVVSVSMAGTTSGVTAAAAGAAIKSLQNSPDEPGKLPQSIPVSVPSPNPLAVEPISTPTQINDFTNPNFPRMDESISYLQWRERCLQEELFTSLRNNERTIPTPQTPVVLEKPNSIRQFVGLIEKKLLETASPNYIANLQTKDPRPDYGQQFVKQIEKALRETANSNYLAMIDDRNYLATMQVVEKLFPKGEISGGMIDNYASSLSFQKPTVPFQDVPLLGRPDQSTIHFHSGISNNFSSIVGGGLYLKKSLDNQFAVQPHLVHSNSIVSGLTFVGLEEIDARNKELASAGIIPTLNLFELATIILENSQIQRSIDYEVASLSQIAQNIIKTNKPNLKQLHVTFSNGGYIFNEALKQLPPEYQETIIVITTGTTAIIDKKLAHKVHNLIGDKDWPSLTVNGAKAVEQAKEKGILEIIPQNETLWGIGGHYAIQPDYHDEVSNFAKKEIIGKYEIY